MEAQKTSSKFGDMGILAMLLAAQESGVVKARPPGHLGSKRHHHDTKRRKKIAKMSRKRNRS